jgi:hypothetical protein
MTIAKRKSSTDDKVEEKRKIIRRSLAEITTEVEIELRRANLRGGINMVVPSRHRSNCGKRGMVGHVASRQASRRKTAWWKRIAWSAISLRSGDRIG